MIYSIISSFVLELELHVADSYGLRTKKAWKYIIRAGH